LKLVYLLITATLMHLVVPMLSITTYAEGINVVVTFPNLIEDVKQLLCPGDRVDYIAPPGIDPHTYTLSSRDVEKLAEADIVISTAHAPFEARIKELHDQGVFTALLIEVTRIPNMTIKKNPVTGVENYHMPIYDPYNYIKFINYLANVMSQFNPKCRDYYLSRAKAVVDKINDIVASTPHLDLEVVADKPGLQYAIEWIGLKIKYLVVKEHDLEPSPQDLMLIEQALHKHFVGIVCITYPPVDSSSQWLLEKALEYNASIVYIPSPLSQKTVVEKLEEISQQIADLTRSPISRLESTSVLPSQNVKQVNLNTLRTIAVVIAIIVLVLITYTVVRRRS